MVSRGVNMNTGWNDVGILTTWLVAAKKRTCRQGFYKIGREDKGWSSAGPKHAVLLDQPQIGPSFCPIIPPLWPTSAKKCLHELHVLDGSWWFQYASVLCLAPEIGRWSLWVFGAWYFVDRIRNEEHEAGIACTRSNHDCVEYWNSMKISLLLYYSTTSNPREWRTTMATINDLWICDIYIYIYICI